MAETPWGPDALPLELEEFDAPQAAGAWLLQDSVVLDQAFAVAAVAWAEHDWLAPLGFMMPAEVGGASLIPVLMRQYRKRWI